MEWIDIGYATKQHGYDAKVDLLKFIQKCGIINTSRAESMRRSGKR